MPSTTPTPDVFIIVETTKRNYKFQQDVSQGIFSGLKHINLQKKQIAEAIKRNYEQAGK